MNIFLTICTPVYNYKLNVRTMHDILVFHFFVTVRVRMR